MDARRTVSAEEDRDAIDAWRARAAICLRLAEAEPDPEMRAKLAIDGRRYLSVAARLEQLAACLAASRA